MMPFSGTVTEANGTTTIRVVGEWEMVTTQGFPGWRGTIRAEAGKQLGMTDYRLTLDDGRTGVISIRGMQQSSSGAAIITFRGQGPPPN
jgi:hypothetical protein